MESVNEKKFGSRAVAEANRLALSVPIKTLAQKSALAPGWVKKFRAGKITKPGFQKVEKIFKAFGYTIKAFKSPGA